MSTRKNCKKGLKKDKASGKCVSLEELKDRKLRTSTLKKLEKKQKQMIVVNEKFHILVKQALDADKAGKPMSSAILIKKYAVNNKALDKIGNLHSLEKIIFDIEEKYSDM